MTPDHPAVMPSRKGAVTRRHGKKEVLKLKLWSRAENIRIKNKGHEGYFVFWDDVYGGGCRAFGSMELAEKYARGEEVTFAEPQKKREIHISAEAQKPPQDEPWNERSTGTEITTEKLVGYHFGASGEELAAVETCFYAEFPKEKTYIFSGTVMVEIPAGTEVFWYGDEFRVVLDPSFAAWELKSGWRAEA